MSESPQDTGNAFFLGALLGAFVGATLAILAPRPEAQPSAAKPADPQAGVARDAG